MVAADRALVRFVIVTWVYRAIYNKSCYIGRMATRRQTLKKIGGSVATVLPKNMLERFNLEAGDEVMVVETDQGILVTPYDPAFEEAMKHYARGAKKFRNALRELAR